MYELTKKELDALIFITELHCKKGPYVRDGCPMCERVYDTHGSMRNVDWFERLAKLKKLRKELD